MGGLAVRRDRPGEAHDSRCRRQHGCAGVGGYYPGTLTSSSGQQASLLLWVKNLDDPNTTIQPNEVFSITPGWDKNITRVYHGASFGIGLTF